MKIGGTDCGRGKAETFTEPDEGVRAIVFTTNPDHILGTLLATQNATVIPAEEGILNDGDQ
jgi:hypothetical protein